MLEAITEDVTEGKAFNIFCFREPEYVMKVISTCMTLKELDGADTRRKYKGQDVQYLVSQLKYWKTFGSHSRHHHQVDNHNNRSNAPISLERKWVTKFWPNRNFAWYLAVTEVNTALTDGHFRKGGNLIPTLQFRRKLAHKMMENTIRVNTVDYGRPRSSTCTPAIVTGDLQKVKNHEWRYDKKEKRVKQEYQKQRCANSETCNQWTRSFLKCTLGLFLWNLCFVEHKFETIINE